MFFHVTLAQFMPLFSFYTSWKYQKTSGYEKTSNYNQKKKYFSHFHTSVTILQHKKMKFSVDNFFSKCEQILSFLWIYWYLPQKSLTEIFSFWAASFRCFSVFSFQCFHKFYFVHSWLLCSKYSRLTF